MLNTYHIVIFIILLFVLLYFMLPKDVDEPQKKESEVDSMELFEKMQSQDNPL
jgi:hypothetical protein